MEFVWPSQVILRTNCGGLGGCDATASSQGGRFEGLICTGISVSTSIVAVAIPNLRSLSIKARHKKWFPSWLATKKRRGYAGDATCLYRLYRYWSNGIFSDTVMLKHSECSGLSTTANSSVWFFIDSLMQQCQGRGHSFQPTFRFARPSDRQCRRGSVALFDPKLSYVPSRHYDWNSLIVTSRPQETNLQVRSGRYSDSNFNISFNSSHTNF